MRRDLPIVLSITLVVLMTACTEPEPTIVEVTREIGVPETVEVTREVTKIVEEVVQETVEVTRIERVVVTATPTPTPISSPTPSSTPTPTPMPTAPPTPTADASSELLRAMRSTRQDLEGLGGVIDDAVRSGVLHCQRTVDLHASILNAPVVDVSGGSDVTQWANARYRQAIQVYSEGGTALAEGCSNWLEGEGKDIVAAQTWTRARKSVNDALEILIPAVEKLE